VDEILEEFAPSAMRGKEIRDGASQASCGSGEIHDYAHVLIIKGVSGGCCPSQPVRRFVQEQCEKSV
jgi:hypothetical protein